MKGIFHIHTKYSYDSLNNPRKIVDYAVKHKINLLLITDHDTIKGSLEAKKYATTKKLPVKIIIGAEYLTDIGDVIGIFLKKEKERGGVPCLSSLLSICCASCML